MEKGTFDTQMRRTLRGEKGMKKNVKARGNGCLDTCSMKTLSGQWSHMLVLQMYCLGQKHQSYVECHQKGLWK